MGIVEIQSVKKSYQNGSSTLTVLNDCSYTFVEGYLYAIVGRSGLGKTTLLSVLGTIEKPDFGNLLIDGQLISKLNNNQLSELRCNHIGFVFQNYCLIDRYTVAENLELALFFGGANIKTEGLERIKEVTKAVNLPEDILVKRVSVLSGGEKQRVSIARALINNPSIIFADEPTGNLDSQNELTVINIFKKLRDEMGITIIMVTHNMKLAEQADKVITLQDGKIMEMNECSTLS